MPTQYKLQYLPSFWEDLAQATFYIRDTLKNPEAASRLLDQVEHRILNQLENPTAATLFGAMHNHPLPYYWFPVGNYMVFYVLDGDVMEVRRFIYGARDLMKIIV